MLNQTQTWREGRGGSRRDSVRLPLTPRMRHEALSVARERLMRRDTMALYRHLGEMRKRDIRAAAPDIAPLTERQAASLMARAAHSGRHSEPAYERGTSVAATQTRYSAQWRGSSLAWLRSQRDGAWADEMRGVSIAADGTRTPLSGSERLSKAQSRRPKVAASAARAAAQRAAHDRVADPRFRHDATQG